MSFVAPTVTGYSGAYDPAFSRAGNGAAANYNAITRYARSSTEWRIAAAMATPGAGRHARRAFRAMAGNNAGASFPMDDPYTRIAAQTVGELVGGVRPTETAYVSTDVGAGAVTNTSIARPWMQAAIDRYFNQNPSSYAVDLSGNGGGGKAGR